MNEKLALVLKTGYPVLFILSLSAEQALAGSPGASGIVASIDKAPVSRNALMRAA